jgi:hypothetical protein
VSADRLPVRNEDCGRTAPTAAAVAAPTAAAAAVARAGLRLLVVAAGGGATAWLLGLAAQRVAGDRNEAWIVGRASGITAFGLLVCVVAMGLVLAHPWRTRLRRPATVTRIRTHVVLAAFTLTFTVLHVVVLATDRYAGVGWRGALLPLGASYRPVPVTLGVVGLYAGLIAGVTAAAAGQLTARLWWPLHKVSGLALVLVWAHGMFAGSDTTALRGLYAGCAAVLIGLALSRYLATTPADRLERLTVTAGQIRTVEVRAASATGARPQATTRLRVLR